MVLKRVPRLVHVHAIGDAEMIRSLADQENSRPFALYTEHGDLLPGQQRVCIESLPGSCPTVTVTFYLDGDSLKILGDS